MNIPLVVNILGIIALLSALQSDIHHRAGFSRFAAGIILLAIAWLISH